MSKEERDNPSYSELASLMKMLAEGWRLNIPLDSDTQTWIETLKQLPRSDIEQRKFSPHFFQKAAELWRKFHAS